MLIYYKYNNELFSLEIHKYTSLFTLKEVLMKKINNKKVVILFKNKILNHLDDNLYLDKIGIENGSQIRINEKIRGGNTFTTILIVLIVLLLFIALPIFLMSGFLPFIIHITGLFVVKIINCFVGFILSKLPRLHDNKAPITFIVKSSLFFFKLFLLFICVSNMFKIVYFFWCQILKSSDGLFTVSDSYCENVETISTIGTVTSYFYIIIYGLLRAPNIFPGSIESFREMAKKNGYGVITTPLDLLISSTKIAIYENKFDFLNFIPIIGPIIFTTLEGYFQALDTGMEWIVKYLNIVIEIGCSKKIDLGKAQKLLNVVSSTKNTKNNQKGGNKNGITNNQELVNAINNMTPAKNNKFIEILKNNSNNEDFKCSLMDVDGGCCSKEIFQSMYIQFKQMLNNGANVQMMKQAGVKDIIELFVYSLNVKQVDEDMNNFYNAFGPYKLLDNNIKAVGATAWRYTICNIFYLAKFFNSIIFEMGTPLDITDTIKCGMLAGNITLVVYLICLIIIVFVIFF